MRLVKIEKLYQDVWELTVRRGWFRIKEAIFTTKYFSIYNNKDIIWYWKNPQVDNNWYLKLRLERWLNREIKRREKGQLKLALRQEKEKLDSIWQPVQKLPKAKLLKE